MSGHRIWIPQLVASLLLLGALNPTNPYAYYVLLRWVCCGVFAFLATKAVTRKREGWVWILAITALIYNPVARVSLNRPIWSVVNIATVIVAGASVVALRHPSREEH